MANDTETQTGQGPVDSHGHFRWHPSYNGRSYAEVERELASEIARDQRSYNLAMEGAEANEHGSLSSVIDLDRKWSDFDLGWAEANPAALAGRIVAFEAERDRRHELIPWRDYREEQGAVGVPIAPASAFGAPWLWAIIVLIVLIIIVIVIVATS